MERGVLYLRGDSGGYPRVYYILSHTSPRSSPIYSLATAKTEHIITRFDLYRVCSEICYFVEFVHLVIDLKVVSTAVPQSAAIAVVYRRVS